MPAKATGPKQGATQEETPRNKVTPFLMFDDQFEAAIEFYTATFPGRRSSTPLGGRAGEPSRCGWITDRFGLSWQIVPKRFIELLADQNPKKVKAVVDAMMKMVKPDVATLEKASAEVS